METVTATLKPLGFLESLLLPLLLFLRRGSQGELLRRRVIWTSEWKERRRAKKELIKQLKKESRIHEQIIKSCLTRLGEAHLPRTDHEAAAGSRKRKVQRVEFEQKRVSPEVIWFKILTRKRTPLGWRNCLPFRVRVTDLIEETTLQELSFACQREVTAVWNNYRRGAWYKVHRLEGVGGLPEYVSFKSILEYFPADMSKATLILGIGEYRKTFSASLEDHPHVLIGGSNGSGKSNIVNVLISSLLMFTDPSEVKFVLIDLKRVEFSFYKRSAHLHKPVVAEEEDAIDTLTELLKEIKRRIELFEEGYAKKLSEWNQLYPKQKLPRIVVVIDEFAELRLASDPKIGKEALRLVQRISNLGRAVGIHLIVCTQRPAAEIIPNHIKINMPLVLAGRTQNADQSRVILSRGDAANLPLLPKGRMIFQSGSEQYTIQTPYIDNDEVRQAVRISRGRGAGVIRLDGSEPVIIPDNLSKLLLEKEDGLLTEDVLGRSLADVAISDKMFGAYAAEVVRQGGVILDDKVYQVVAGDQGPKLALIPEIAAPPVLTLVQPDDPRKEALTTWRTIRQQREEPQSA